MPVISPFALRTILISFNPSESCKLGIEHGEKREKNLKENL